jgi:hypothetical protein
LPTTTAPWPNRSSGPTRASRSFRNQSVIYATLY